MGSIGGSQNGDRSEGPISEGQNERMDARE